MYFVKIVYLFSCLSKYSKGGLKESGIDKTVYRVCCINIKINTFA